MEQQPGSCPFMGLPTELRLLIYDYALVDAAAITVGSAKLVGSHPDIIHRLYGDGRSPCAGLPQHHEPVIDLAYNASLLSLANPSLVPLTPATCCPPEESNTPLQLTRASLQLVNRKIKAELDTHCKRTPDKQTSLFISFPTGLHVLKMLAPNLLSQARSIHIAGSYTPRSFSSSRDAYLGSTSYPPFVTERSPSGFTPNSAGQLGSLVASTFGPELAHPHVRKLELRMYYPGSNRYGTVWGDESSPVAVVLRSVNAGNIDIEVYRGNRGTGVYLSLERATYGGDQKLLRHVSTRWRRLEEGGRGQPACGTWVVDPKWPEWENDMETTGKDGAEERATVTAQAQ